MSKSRRQFLTQTSLALLAAATVYRSYAQQPADLPREDQLGRRGQGLLPMPAIVLH